MSNYRLLDEQFERQLRKNGGIFFERPRYLTICLKTDTDLKELVQVSLFLQSVLEVLINISTSLFSRKSRNVLM